MSDEELERQRDMQEIGFKASCLTDSQRQQLVRILRNPALPDLDSIEQQFESLRLSLAIVTEARRFSSIAQAALDKAKGVK